eukprot:2550769-Pyramimonas_sp.AAC.2
MNYVRGKTPKAGANSSGREQPSGVVLARVRPKRRQTGALCKFQPRFGGPRALSPWATDVVDSTGGLLELHEF